MRGTEVRRDTGTETKASFKTHRADRSTRGRDRRAHRVCPSSTTVSALTGVEIRDVPDHRLHDQAAGSPSPAPGTRRTTSPTR